ncbi:MAG: SGNH/GDSL hydrolase family protein [bacterium]|nr:SGNH/GDSL hydrolase family protein [bacterium]
MRSTEAILAAILMGGACMGMPANAASTDEERSMALRDGVIAVRDGLGNCRAVFEGTGKGRVAFIGGSITVASGWRPLTMKLLEERFPNTEFDFVNAGIGGTDSTLGAYRVESDCFANGPVDLLFLEFAVNDGDGECPDNRRVRAMEGIVRHVRRLNPKVDIVIQYFLDKGKLQTITDGAAPLSIQDHDQVAAHYGIPFVNQAVHVAARLNAGEFEWDKFSGDSCHPSGFGHQIYAQNIDLLFDAAWSGPVAEPTDRPMPEPLDPENLENGHFIPHESAEIVDGWERLDAWDAPKKCNYGGTVNVLASTTPGASAMIVFEGTRLAISAIAGMDAGIIETSIDGGEFVALDLFDRYCPSFHRPVCHTLANDLAPGEHTIVLRIGEGKNEKSEGHAVRILEFAAN